ncbi:MAG: ADP-forming succinate--CoA ligase subunit beta [Gemmataceae bacterium]|nr:ADP-forming succinate--CoA ligase subunit beta [Gemmataceae bacterium]MDW8243825.1 ADP-forming succinate--CoA ligase subunit beta [Thermogemmata sp.]
MKRKQRVVTMKIHEYQAKELLAAAGAAIPQHIVVRSGAEAAAAFDVLSNGGGVVVKAQVYAGGRGAGQLLDYPDKLGGVKFCPTRELTQAVAEAMLRHRLRTRQTGPEGVPIRTLIVQADAQPDREYYLAMVLDRAAGLPLLMACAEGGMEIEEIAARHPEKILKTYVAPETGLLPFQARRLAYELGFTPAQVPQVENILHALARVFLQKDATLAEINPLALTRNGQIVVLDAKIDFDDNALFRHPDIAALRDVQEENPLEIRAAQAHLNYIQLDGTIGCLVNGAGLAMATMDIIKYYGGQPANFLDVGGSVTPEGAIEAFRIILSDAKVRGILVNVFGGIARCDLIAEALVQAGREVGFRVPVVVRLEGTNAEKARQILAEAANELPTLKTAADLAAAAQLVVELSR